MPVKKNDDGQLNMMGSFREFQDTKHIDRTTLVSVLEESFRNVLAKIFGSDENFDVIVNPDKGDFEIYRNRIVVANGEVADENKEISLADAQKIDTDYEVGEEVSEAVDFAKFGRRAILTLRQTLASKILELEHDALYNKYKDRVGKLISAEVYHKVEARGAARGRQQQRTPPSEERADSCRRVSQGRDREMCHRAR